MEARKKGREDLKKKAEKVLNDRERFTKSDEKVRVGVESEYFILDTNQLRPVDREERNPVHEKFDFSRRELGEFTIELVTDHRHVEGLKQLWSSIKAREEEVKQELGEGLELVRNGVQPFTDPGNVGITHGKGFESCMDHYSLEEEERALGQDSSAKVSGPRAAGLICAIHTNVEAKSFEDAVEKANYTYMISPYISAISGNARFLGGKDTGLSDLRMVLWDRSHGSEEQIGVLDSYYSGMEDYLDRVVNQEFIPGEVTDDLRRAVSNFWKDSRIKVLEDDLVVESRISSVQPTPEEDVAVHGFHLGRVLYALMNDEELMDIEKVNRNREEALRKGLDAELFSPEGEKRKASELLLNEIGKAREGLEFAGVDEDGFLEILENRARKGLTPSDRKAGQVQREGSGEEVIYSAIENLTGVQR